MGFTVEQFLHVFDRYNHAIWPMQIVAYVIGAALVVLALSKVPWAGRVILFALAFLWAWMGVAYMWLYFADINKLAYGFGALFVIEAVLLLVAAVRERPGVFAHAPGRRIYTGAVLIAYAMIVYPLIGMALGHGYPRSPMFGVAPCPTTIFTFGLLIWSARPRRALLWVPLLWSLIGFFAAVKLGVREDVGLLISGVTAAVVILRTRRPTDEPALSLETTA